MPLLQENQENALWVQLQITSGSVLARKMKTSRLNL